MKNNRLLISGKPKTLTRVPGPGPAFPKSFGAGHAGRERVDRESDRFVLFFFVFFYPRADTRESDLADIAGQRRTGHERRVLAPGLDEAGRRGRRVQRAGALLQGVGGQGARGRRDRRSRWRRLLVVRVDQGPVRVPAAAPGLRVLHVHVDLVPDPVSAVHRADNVRRGGTGHAQRVPGECTLFPRPPNVMRLSRDHGSRVEIDLAKSLADSIVLFVAFFQIDFARKTSNSLTRRVNSKLPQAGNV